MKEIIRSSKKLFVILVSFMIMISLGSTNVKAEINDNECDVSYTKTLEDDEGNVYEMKVEKYIQRGVNIVTLINLNTQEKNVMEVGNDYYELTTYEYKKDSYQELSSIHEDFNDTETENNNFIAQFKYTGSLIKETYKKKYSYRDAESKYGNYYIEIACNAAYRIPYWKLDSKCCDRIDKYTDNINACRAEMKKYYEEGTYSTIFNIAGMLATAISQGIASAVAIPLVAIAVGYHIATIQALYNAENYYDNVVHYYKIIKGYGTKVE